MAKRSRLAKLGEALCCLPLAKNEKKDKKDKRDKKEKLLDDCEGKDCVICLEPLKSKKQARIVVQCNHIFHNKCLMQWGRACAEEMTTFNCPICRKFVEKLIDHRTRKCFPIEDLFKRRTIVPATNSLLTGRVIVVDEDKEDEEARLQEIEEKFGPLGPELLSVSEFLKEQAAYNSPPSQRK